VDTVCCDAACGGSCDVCKQSLGASADGVCTVISGPGSPSCTPYLCMGATHGCPTSCTLDSECATGNLCLKGVCRTPLPNGSACTAPAECASGSCPDGFCCDKPCDGACDVCAKSLGATADGTCTNVAGPGSPICAPYLCKATGPACPTTCALDTDCTSGNYCDATKKCVAQLPKGGPCQGANQCGTGFCVDGVCCLSACGGGVANDCQACSVITGSKDDGTCSLLTGTSCDDGDACTQKDTCQAGVCTGSPVACVARDQCHVAGTCSKVTGVCDDPAATDGTACDDANACTQKDSCQASVCTGGSPVVCVAKDQCHLAGTCNQATGVCDDPAAADGTACDDGDKCTESDVCKAGACAGGPVKCVAKDQCHSAGGCDPSSGACSNPALPDGTACDDGSACTKGDTCQAGSCAGAALTCAALDECHQAGTCDPATGACTNPAKPNGTACSKGTCSGGQCSAGGVAPVSSCGCATGSGSGAPVLWGALAMMLAALRRRPRIAPPRRR
jgi:MYXO-CTERM domain-containing protein